VRRLRIPSAATSGSGSFDSVSKYAGLRQHNADPDFLVPPAWIESPANGRITRQFDYKRNRNSLVGPLVQRVHQVTVGLPDEAARAEIFKEARSGKNAKRRAK